MIDTFEKSMDILLKKNSILFVNGFLQIINVKVVI